MNAQTYAVRVLRQTVRLRKIVGRLRSGKRTIYVDDRVAFYRALWEGAAHRLGAHLEPLADDVWEVCRGRARVRLRNHQVPIDDPVTLSIAGRKDLCYALLSQISVPVPDHVVFGLNDLDKGLGFLKRRDGPIVVKPASGTSGARGVSLWVETPGAFLAAVALASLYDARIIAEEMLAGESYRLLFLAGRLIHAVRRTGLRVTGNGALALDQLIARDIVHHAPALHEVSRTFLRTDRDCGLTLRTQRLGPRDVPAADQQVLVRSRPLNAPTGPESMVQYNEDVTTRVCPAIVDAAAAAVARVKTCFAGVDLVTVNPDAPLAESGGRILEINTTPGLHHHYHLQGQSSSPDPADLVLEYVLTAAG